MKGLLSLVLKTIGVKNLIGMVWSEFAMPEFKKYVAKTSNEYDDKALLVVDGFVQSYLVSVK